MDDFVGPYTALSVKKAFIDAHLDIIDVGLEGLAVTQKAEDKNTFDTNKKEFEDHNQTEHSSKDAVSASKKHNEYLKLLNGDNVLDLLAHSSYSESMLNETTQACAEFDSIMDNGKHIDDSATAPDDSVKPHQDLPEQSQKFSQVYHSTPIKKFELNLKGIEKKSQKSIHNQIATSKELDIVAQNLRIINNGTEYSHNSTLEGEETYLESGCENVEEPVRNNSTSMIKPSTLNLSDLESIVTEPLEVSLSRSFANLKQDMVKELQKHHSKEIQDLKHSYDEELKKLQAEKDELIKNLKAQSPGTSVINYKYFEEIKTELERRCQKYEIRNRQLTLKMDELSRNSFELERKNRNLENEKSVLQEQCFKHDQEKRMLDGELLKVQNLLGDSLSARRTLEDELLYLRTRELNSNTKLSDSGNALKELREDLNISRRECDDKDEMIANITNQRNELQENLSEALNQINRLEEASSQRTREKGLFHKLLEEYEVLYNQHQRIRNLYNEAIQRLDQDSSDSDVNKSPKRSNLGLTIKRENSSSRKKWSESPQSPAIRGQDDPFFAERDTTPDRLTKDAGQEFKNPLHVGSTSLLTRSSGLSKLSRTSNRNSTGSMLAWETSPDTNNNIPWRNQFQARKNTNDVSSTRKEIWKCNSLPEDKFNDIDSIIPTKLTEGNERNEKEWIVHNLDGITRFDVVFASSSQLNGETGDIGSNRKTTNRSENRKSTSFLNFEALKNGNEDKSSEIFNLENDLTKLSGEKNEIESQLRRFPSSGSGRSRRLNVEKQELLEERLDKVVKSISNIRMTLRKYNAL